MIDLLKLIRILILQVAAMSLLACAAGCGSGSSDDISALSSTMHDIEYKLDHLHGDIEDLKESVADLTQSLEEIQYKIDMGDLVTCTGFTIGSHGFGMDLQSSLGTVTVYDNHYDLDKLKDDVSNLQYDVSILQSKVRNLEWDR